MDEQQLLSGFRKSRWRYSQFVILGLVIAALVKWLSTFTWLMALLAGAVLAVVYFLFEKKRGAI